MVRVAEDEATQGRASLENVKEEADDVAGLDDDAEQESQQPAIKMSLARRGPCRH